MIFVRVGGFRLLSDNSVISFTGVSKMCRSIDSQSEESRLPRSAGNMVVASRCTEHGYGLICSCGRVFNYIPNEKGYAIVDGSSRAICPECCRIWDESKPLIPDVKPVYMIVSADLKDGDNVTIMACVGPSRLDIMAQVDRVLNQVEDYITGFHFQFTNKKGYDDTLERIKKKAAHKLSQLFDLLLKDKDADG